MLLNICSLKTNFLNLQLEITDKFRPTVIGICETKITNEIESLYNLTGYGILTNNNQSNKGGLALYIKKSIPAMIKPAQTFIWGGIETNFADLNTPNGIITVGLIHKRSIDISVENFTIALETIISSLDPNNKTYIMGDFNINLLDYNNSAPIENFLNQMISRNFFSVITRATRVTPISSTLIDNIFCNRIDNIGETSVITTNISDQFPIFLKERTPSLTEDIATINYIIFSD